ncbi:MAG: hypothetical protein HWE34_16935 [Methylocystaceae bacterium]|nr:hypothetical protein [Methylocystaceae bacterium]
MISLATAPSDDEDEDVTATLELVIEDSGYYQVDVIHKPRLLSDNGSSYISGDLSDWLED